VTAYEDHSKAPGGSEFTVETYKRGISLPSPKPPVGPTFSIAAAAPAGGKLVLHTAMSTACLRCVAELPQLRRLRELFGAEELSMVGISVDPADTPAALKAYEAKHSPAYRLLIGVPQDQVSALKEHMARALGALATPATVVTDGGSQVLLTTWGVPTVSQLRRMLEDLR
jgi:peroxiredoxin